MVPSGAAAEDWALPGCEVVVLTVELAAAAPTEAEALADDDSIELVATTGLLDEDSVELEATDGLLDEDSVELIPTGRLLDEDSVEVVASGGLLDVDPVEVVAPGGLLDADPIEVVAPGGLLDDPAELVATGELLDVSEAVVITLLIVLDNRVDDTDEEVATEIEAEPLLVDIDVLDAVCDEDVVTALDIVDVPAPPVLDEVPDVASALVVADEDPEELIAELDENPP